MWKKISERLWVQEGDTAHGVIRKHRYLLYGLVGVGGIVFACVMTGVEKVSEGPVIPKEELKKVSVGHLVDQQEVWASRLEAEAQKVGEIAKDLKIQNEFQEKRLKLLEEALSAKSQEMSQSPQNGTVSSPSSAPKTIGPSAFNPASAGGEGVFQGDVYPPSASMSGDVPSGLSPSPFPADQMRLERKIIHQTSGGGETYKNAKYYVPAGTYAKAILTSGLQVSTAVSTQGNPQPIHLRLADAGNLPRGWKSRMKDAVVSGSCYGDLSAERAFCRIHKLTFVEKDGVIVEKDVEGWILGEDGAPGIRGTVVDRAGKVAREALFAGILSGLSNFMKFEAQKGVFPVSPFGQTNAMTTGDVLKGGVGSGVSNAFEKLADFSLKRAEAMQPIITAQAGRFVDVVFKKGFDIRPFVSDPSLRVVSSTDHKQE